VSVFGAGRKSLQEAFAEVFERPEAASDLPAGWFAGRNDLWIFREVARREGIADGDFERFREALYAAYLKRLEDNMAGWENRLVLPGVPELLERLACGGENDAPRALGLVTGNLEGGARIKLGAFGLDRWFAAGGYGEDAIDRGEIAALARKRFESRLGRRIDPDEVALVGDTEYDVQAARACGYRSVAVATGWTPMESLRETGPDLLLADLSDPAPLLQLLSA